MIHIPLLLPLTSSSSSTLVTSIDDKDLAHTHLAISLLLLRLPSSQQFTSRLGPETFPLESPFDTTYYRQTISFCTPDPVN